MHQLLCPEKLKKESLNPKNLPLLDSFLKYKRTWILSTEIASLFCAFVLEPLSGALKYSICVWVKKYKLRML
jgi:hypothetical protein